MSIVYRAFEWWCCSVSEGNGHSRAAHRTFWLCSPPTLWHLPLPPSHSRRSSSPAQASTDSIFPAFHTYKPQIFAKYWATTGMFWISLLYGPFLYEFLNKAKIFCATVYLLNSHKVCLVWLCYIFSYLFSLSCVGQHDYSGRFLLPNHSPEISHCLWFWA